MTGVGASVRVQRRRALEALRAGVPNRDAVVALGSLQVGVEDRFSQLLESVAGLPSGPAPGGMLVGGGFGSGKSHVLEHLAHVALSRGFVVSKVADALNDAGKPVRGSRVLILGMAYKKDVDDPRESPGFELMDLLLKKGAVVAYNDPHIPKLPPVRRHPR